MRALLAQVARFARADSNVLISGETGTGKNALAFELHARGPRRGRPFVTIDCAALSPPLIDSELFGHERGAFTDAVIARAGRFEVAGTGTVYLDAVGELPVEAQGKLLRIVEEKRVARLGAQTSMAVGARIVASAGAQIEDAVRSGAFRHDLYHRLRVLPLFIPPLRERPEDVPTFASSATRSSVHFRRRRAGLSRLNICRRKSSKRPRSRATQPWRGGRRWTKWNGAISPPRCITREAIRPKRRRSSASAARHCGRSASATASTE